MDAYPKQSVALFRRCTPESGAGESTGRHKRNNNEPSATFISITLPAAEHPSSAYRALHSLEPDTSVRGAALARLSTPAPFPANAALTSERRNVHVFIRPAPRVPPKTRRADHLQPPRAESSLVGWIEAEIPQATKDILAFCQLEPCVSHDLLVSPVGAKTALDSPVPPFTAPIILVSPQQAAYRASPLQSGSSSKRQPPGAPSPRPYVDRC